MGMPCRHLIPKGTFTTSIPMKKFLTLLFAFICMAFSEMRGQGFFSYYYLNTGSFGGLPMASTDGVNYSVTKTFDEFNDINLIKIAFSVTQPGQDLSCDANDFPRGVAVENYGSGGGLTMLPNGTYLIQFNKITKLYSFTGGSCRLFDDCGISITSCNKISVFLNSSFSSFQWKRNGQPISGATGSEYIHPSNLSDGNYSYTCDAFCIDSGVVISSNPIIISNPPLVSAQLQTSNSNCINREFNATINQPGSDWTYQWKKDGQAISGANQSTYNAAPQTQNATYTCLATCPTNNSSKESNSLAVPGCFSDSTSGINYMLVQNVSTIGNSATNKTIQVQFDLSWGNTWWDDINWDAAWVFMKYKTAAGEWKHAKINPTGFDKGQGSPSIIQPTADKLGAFIRLGLKGQGNFNVEGMQLQWNYGLDGLNSVNGLEVKVFATEMVYQPQGDFTLSTDFSPGAITAPAGNIPVVNARLSPRLSGNLRIKGDVGLDLNSDGTIDNTTFPTGYKPFYVFKYEMSEQAYADFLNCLSASQVTNLGIAGTSISLNQGQYFAAAPNRACKSAVSLNLLAYADWSGLRPLSFFELHKAWNGPNSPNNESGRIACIYYDCVGSDLPENSTGNQGKGFYGAKDLKGNLLEPFVEIQSPLFSETHGDGILDQDGSSNFAQWSNLVLNWGNFTNGDCQNCFDLSAIRGYGFRLCRSAE